MKKIFCYLGILVLFVLAFLPPALRIFLPDKRENNKEVLIPERVVLSCSNDKFITNTSYENNEIQMILIKKLNQGNEDLESEEVEKQENLQETNELDLLFTSLKNNGNVTYTEVNDGNVIQIDLSISISNNLDIPNITKKTEDQKTYYEQQGLTCVIRK